jgi:hypothetical protein
LTGVAYTGQATPTKGFDRCRTIEEVDVDVSVAEQARAFEEPGAQEHPPDFRSESGPASEQLSRQHEWRWIPDPAEVDLPTPSPNPDAGPSNALIRALAWANLHYWG